MPALKDFQNFKLDLANTPLASSPLWNMQITAIVPQQLHALRTKLDMQGYDGTDSLFRKITDSLALIRFSEEGIEDAPIFDYKGPDYEVFTEDKLMQGFARMNAPMPDAILFALEVGLTPEQTITLTWEKARVLINAKKLNEAAREILDSQVRHITSKYVFWCQRGIYAQPMFGMELEVFEQYGMVWSELEEVYKTIR